MLHIQANLLDHLNLDLTLLW